MATLDEPAILNDISDNSEWHEFYLMSANKCQQQTRKNDRKNTLK